MTFSPSIEQGIVLFLLPIGCMRVCVCVTEGGLFLSPSPGGWGDGTFSLLWVGR